MPTCCGQLPEWIGYILSAIIGAGLLVIISGSLPAWQSRSRASTSCAPHGASQYRTTSALLADTKPGVSATS
jgi:hypothetical protein